MSFSQLYIVRILVDWNQEGIKVAVVVVFFLIKIPIILSLGMDPLMISPSNEFSPLTYIHCALLLHSSDVTSVFHLKFSKLHILVAFF